MTIPSAAPTVLLTVDDRTLAGHVALPLAPGTVAKAQQAALEAALAGPLADRAADLGAVVAAPPHRFAKPLPGKDEEGRTRFAVRGRVEGGLLVPNRS